MPTESGNKFAVFEINIYYTVQYYVQMQHMQYKLVLRILEWTEYFTHS